MTMCAWNKPLREIMGFESLKAKLPNAMEKQKCSCKFFSLVVKYYTISVPLDMCIWVISDILLELAAVSRCHDLIRSAMSRSFLDN